jgi:hypothetical protein
VFNGERNFKIGKNDFQLSKRMDLNKLLLQQRSHFLAVFHNSFEVRNYNYHSLWLNPSLGYFKISMGRPTAPMSTYLCVSEYSTEPSSLLVLTVSVE